MSYKYLLLLDVDGNEHESTSRLEFSLSEMGMRLHLLSDRAKLFLPRETPSLATPGGGMVVGHLFARDGTPIHDASGFPPSATPTGIHKHILENCWGEYLLVQPDDGDGNGLIVSRSPSPSGDLPCIYSLQNGAGFVASDILLPTALDIYRKRIDWDFIAQCLTYPQEKTGRTGFSGIRELLPGCALQLHDTDVRIIQDWSPWDFVALDQRHSDPREAARELRRTIETAVHAWAGVDKAVLLELSGGLDSSIVGACLRGTPANVVCCTLVTPVPGADEQYYAGLVAKELGVDLHAELLDYDNARFNFEPPSHFTTPRIGVLQYAIDQAMETVAARHQVASSFTGGGGDTVFSYLKTAAPAADAFRELGFTAGLTAIGDLAELHQCTLWKASRLTLAKLLRSSATSCVLDSSFLNTNLITDVPEIHPWITASAGSFPGDRERIRGLVTTQMFRDSAPRGVKRCLRMPLLSQPVVEACLKIPSWMWIAGGRNRAIARAAFSDLLPPDVLNRRSKGTFLSYLGSSFQKTKGQMQDYLLSGHLQAHGLLDPQALNRYFDGNQSQRDRSFTRIIDLCMVENWVRHQA